MLDVTDQAGGDADGWVDGRADADGPLGVVLGRPLLAGRVVAAS
jgi:hypothetical protein